MFGMAALWCALAGLNRSLVYGLVGAPNAGNGKYSVVAYFLLWCDLAPVVAAFGCCLAAGGVKFLPYLCRMPFCCRCHMLVGVDIAAQMALTSWLYWLDGLLACLEEDWRYDANLWKSGLVNS
ncbi:hypothetical protein Nepgr_014778 [Nepenthes gracilis]|uniref:Uncharacterized protein n=1 Tax=Nepenthes gracilis TaxID=150966 RepID=A0AAD3SKN8_NEPGR|nr:hypothetical protein Nepgr_014778 [Nepenthes gracilis]